MGVRVLARSQGEPFVRALHLEAELPVERDGRFVGREDAQVQRSPSLWLRWLGLTSCGCYCEELRRPGTPATSPRTR